MNVCTRNLNNLMMMGTRRAFTPRLHVRHTSKCINTWQSINQMLTSHCALTPHCTFTPHCALTHLTTPSHAPLHPHAPQCALAPYCALSHPTHASSNYNGPHAPAARTTNIYITCKNIITTVSLQQQHHHITHATPFFSAVCAPSTVYVVLFVCAYVFFCWFMVIDRVCCCALLYVVCVCLLADYWLLIVWRCVCLQNAISPSHYKSNTITPSQLLHAQHTPYFVLLCMLRACCVVFCLLFVTSCCGTNFSLQLAQAELMCKHFQNALVTYWK